MSPQPILTPVLSYWDFKNQVFDDASLRYGNLKMFINRDEELYSLHNSLSNPLTGIYGSLGVGKSSLLHRLMWNLHSPNLQFIYLYSSFSFNTIYLDILTSLLISIITKKIKVANKINVDFEEELKRIEANISTTFQKQIRGNVAIFTAHAQKSQTISLTPHDSKSACDLISLIFENLEKPLVVIIDTLEKLQFSKKVSFKYLSLISQLAETINNQFNFEGISFIISLSERFRQLVTEANKISNGTFSFSFGRLIPLENFTSEDLKRLIVKRLEKANWKKSFYDFINLDAFWLLYAASYGHPRRSLRIIQSTMEYIAKNKLSRKIDLKAMNSGITICEEKADKIDINIIQYLHSNGAQSNLDEDFQKAVGLKRVQLGNRLKQLKDKIGLVVTSKKEGQFKRDIYQLPKV